jgi:hypothetical protein
MMSKAQRLDRAMQRCETATADLLAAAERWTLASRSIWDIRNDRKELLEVARRYAGAMQSIYRLRGK